MKHNTRFIYYLSAITILSYLVIGIVFYGFLPEKRHFSFFLIPAVLYAITQIFHHFLTKTALRKPKKFVPMFLGLTGAKLLLYLILFISFVWVFPEHIIPFVSIFFAVYLSLTVVEISALLKFLKENSSNLN